MITRRTFARHAVSDARLRVLAALESAQSATDAEAFAAIIAAAAAAFTAAAASNEVVMPMHSGAPPQRPRGTAAEVAAVCAATDGGVV